ncbi:SH3 domain-binding glutamic acid-rich-like protein 3 [Genypterus blacodes]|uniref:SH3 domain-binding glutamic acid-rich-like protein 3 n=1 Tax=Genypterus blacodes TaxID=154954 RepID=UPI003F7691F3
MSITVFVSSVSSNLRIKKKQQNIESILESKKIDFKLVDIAQNSDDKDRMRVLAGNPTALPPQIVNGDVYCGDSDAFDNAVEMESLDAFLKL